MVEKGLNFPQRERKLVAFRGVSVHKISGPAGRIHLPSDFRQALLNRKVNRLIVIKEAGHLRVWPEDEWEKEEARYQSLSLDDERVADFLESLYSNLESVDVDVAGRFVLSDEMRGSAEIKDQVLILGLGRIFELWNPEGFKWKKKEKLEPNFKGNREYVNGILESRKTDKEE